MTKPKPAKKAIVYRVEGWTVDADGHGAWAGYIKSSATERYADFPTREKAEAFMVKLIRRCAGRPKAYRVARKSV